MLLKKHGITMHQGPATWLATWRSDWERFRRGGNGIAVSAGVPPRVPPGEPLELTLSTPEGNE